MYTRTLGENGPQISEVGLGCWQLGGDWGAEIDKTKAFEILQAIISHLKNPKI